MSQKLELLAPAGNFEKLKFALVYGADAVYAGQPQFSLRARENSFSSVEDIEAALNYTHSLGKKFYLTSNIIPHNNKIEPFQKSLANFIEMKPDALIMSDPGMIKFVRSNFPKQEIHLSVQANCTNWSTAKFWWDLGVKRIILSRELNLREIKVIHEKLPELELEAFVHGSICMAYSGRCLLSNYMSYRDSNQGACSNACRFKYNLYAKNSPQKEDYLPLEGEFYLKENESGEFMEIDEDQYGTYIMNSKDMCAIEHLDKIHDSGISSFKVEGRTKSLYYVAQVIRSYRKAMDDLEKGLPITQKHIDEIKKVDSRGFIPGFFIPQRDLPQNYETTRVFSETAAIAGLVRSYDKEKKQATISVKGQFFEGELLEVIDPNSSYQINVCNLWNKKSEKVEKLSPGMNDCKIDLPQDPGPFGIIVKCLSKEMVEKSDKISVI